MDRDQIEKWAHSVGVDPGDEGFGIILLAWQASRRAALDEAKAACDASLTGIARECADAIEKLKELQP